MPRTRARAVDVAPITDRSSDLFARRDAMTYNPDEREFSRFVEERVERLLKGELNCLCLLRRYHQQPGILGAPLPQNGLNPRALRLTVVEEVLTRVLTFLQTGMPGGPIAQETRNDRLIERQLHTTRFPHIVIERIDAFESGTGQALETEWIVRRMQNQKVEIRISRALDIANLGLEFLRASR